MLSRLPETITKADLLASVAPPAGAATPVESWESVFQFVDRFSKQLQTIEGVISNITKVGGNLQTQRGPAFAPHRVKQIPPPPGLAGTNRVTPPPEPQPPDPDPPEPEPEPPKPPTTMRVYASVLGLLSDMPPEMTAMEMLDFCKQNKNAIVPLLDNVLKAE